MKQNLFKHLLWSTAAFAAATGASAADILVSDLKNTLGEGSSTAILLMSWGDDVALDNLVEGVKFESGASVADIVASALRYDPRFYALKNADDYVAFGFDTNGDNSAAVSIGETALELTEGVASTTDPYDEAKGSSEYDHWKINGEEGDWKVFINGTEAEWNRTVNDNDEITLEYVAKEATAPADKAYTFMLRPADQLGVWLQPHIDYTTANGKSQVFPMISNICGEKTYLYGAKLAFEIYLSDGETQSTAMSVSLNTWGNTDDMRCKINILSAVDEVIIKPYLNIRKIWEEGGSQSVKRVYGDPTTVDVTVANPVTSISLEGVEEGSTIELDNMGTYILKPVYEPENADFTGYNATFGDESIVSLYKNVNALVAHREGETTLTVASPDGSVSKTYNVKVKGVDPENKPDDEFSDGVIWLNEEWFTHTSGSLNYIDADGNVFYRAYGNQNNNMAFGATSQFGAVYADKLIVMSKQAWDNGDTREKSGGRVVVADARTMKRIGSIDEIGGDGRTFVGINPSKGYIGTTAGVRVLNLDDVTVADADIEGTAPSRNGQIGDMVKAGKYVFATVVGNSVLVIDTETDAFVEKITASGVQSVIQSKDGRVWIAYAKKLVPVNPETLELGNEYTIPGGVTCSSGSWRHANIMASTKENVLLWSNGGSWSTTPDLYRWNIDEVEDPSTLEPVFKYVTKGDDDVNMGSGYATPAYDDRTDTYMFATMPGFGINALYNWYHFVDATTGEVKHRIKLPEYWWFPAMPIMPDKYAAEIDIEDFTIDVNDEPQTFDLAALVSDQDNHDCNISVSLVSEPMTAMQAEGAPAEVALEGKTLTVTPKAAGTHTFTLAAESNGKVSNKTVNVKVTDISSGIDNIIPGEASVFTVFDMTGLKVGVFMGESHSDIMKSGFPAGVYIVKGDGKAMKFTVK